MGVDWKALKEQQKHEKMVELGQIITEQIAAGLYTKDNVVWAIANQIVSHCDTSESREKYIKRCAKAYSFTTKEELHIKVLRAVWWNDLDLVFSPYRGLNQLEAFGEEVGLDLD